MITCNLMGGLGNQLFQIFTTISCALESTNQFVFTNAKTLGTGNTTVRITYWNTFLFELKPFLTNLFPTMTQIKENGFHYQDIPIHLLQNKDVCLFGYFQSYKYFQPRTNFIYKMLKIQQKKKEVFDKCGYSKKYLEDTISLHFRMGDYKKSPNVHPIMPYEYYENAISKIYLKNPKKMLNVIYFCENEDIDDVNEKIIRLQFKFPKYIFVRASYTCMLEDWEQMLLMSMCKYNVIANSSFSWWSAYLNTEKDRHIYYPDVWFGKACNHDLKDLFPPSWIKVEIT